MTFKLIDKIHNLEGFGLGMYKPLFFEVEDIKEFIRLLKEGLYRDWQNGDIGITEYYRRLEEIDKLTGFSDEVTIYGRGCPEYNKEFSDEEVKR